MNDFRAGVVIPVGPAREDNLRAVLGDLQRQTYQPHAVVLVWDGIQSTRDFRGFENVEIFKHQPGEEQPRNVGVDALRRVEPECTHVWFLDTDIRVGPDCLAAFVAAHDVAPEPHIMVGPYDWLLPNVGGVHPECRLGLEFEDRCNYQICDHLDERWVSFDEHDPARVIRFGHEQWNDEDESAKRGRQEALGAGLACFSGNLVWPIREFLEIGGFCNDMHHGRCEDGELGLRAAAEGVGISFVRDARGYHQWHPVNIEWVLATNAVDVPLLNRMHPWMEDAGYVMTAKDGIRFDFRCPQCDLRMNSLLYWKHQPECVG